MDYFTSDLHLGHRLICEKRGFESIEAMNSLIYAAFDPCRKGDRVFLLGDLGFNVDTVALFLRSLLERKIEVYWIQGNHDRDVWNIQFEESLRKRLHKYQEYLVKSYGSYHNLFLSHYPMLVWNKSHHGSFLLHGHGHTDTMDRPVLDNIILGKRLNVNLEFHDYKLWTRDEIEDFMHENRPRNIDWLLLNGTEEEQKKAYAFLNSLGQQINNFYTEIKEGYNDRCNTAKSTDLHTL